MILISHISILYLMKELIYELNNLRIEISFKSFDELRLILSFCQQNNLNKINMPCKNNLKKEFLLNSIKISREEFPNLDLIPHFSILHEFKRNRVNTIESFIEFFHFVKRLGCNELLLISGSQKRSTLDASSTLSYLKEKKLFSYSDLSIGVAFNPYLNSFLFREEIIKLEKKLQSGLVKSIWIQFGTEFKFFESRIDIVKKLIFAAEKANSNKTNIKLFGSILIPSRQFLARFKYRPWKGVYCSKEFLESVDSASHFVMKLLKLYKKFDICPLIETDVSNDDKLNSLLMILQS